MNKIYLLTFDRDPLFDYVTFHNRFVKLAHVKDWFHYLHSNYIFVSDKDINDITKEIMELMPNKWFFLVEVTLENSNGWLPAQAWEWIQDKKFKRIIGAL